MGHCGGAGAWAEIIPDGPGARYDKVMIAPFSADSYYCNLHQGPAIRIGGGGRGVKSVLVKGTLETYAWPLNSAGTYHCAWFAETHYTSCPPAKEILDPLHG